ncbi:hypothetical protein Tco_0805128, partial [Tanacetum coccineum]
KLGWLELGAHAKYALTCNSRQMNQPEKEYDNFSFGKDDDGVEDEGGGSFTVNSWSFLESKDMRVK